jgi:hypothetical protein
VVRKAESDRPFEGKVIPLKSHALTKAKDSEQQGANVPLPIKPRSPTNFEWEIGYFPPSLKSYYRTVLLSLKEKQRIGNQRLRDRIMQAEDHALSAEHLRQYGTKPKSRLRDTRLTLDDLKKWLASGAIHQLGDPKFSYVNRYVQSLLAQGLLEDFELRYSAERKYFHQLALRDIFSIGYQDEKLIRLLDRYEGHCLISAGPLDGRAPLPTAVMLLDGFSSGISPATILFSSVQLGEHHKKQEIPEGWLNTLAQDRFPLILRGYLTIVAKHPSGDPPLNPYLEGRFILANADIHNIGLGDLRAARFLAYALLQITKSPDGDLMRYGTSVDATHFPDEVFPKSRLDPGATSKDEGPDTTAMAQLHFKFLPHERIAQELTKKFGGVYEA